MYHINRRTDGPLNGYSHLGRDKTTSRCQTPPSIWIIREDQPVIPSVPSFYVNDSSTQNHSVSMTNHSSSVSFSFSPLLSFSVRFFNTGKQKKDKKRTITVQFANFTVKPVFAITTRIFSTTWRAIGPSKPSLGRKVNPRYFLMGCLPSKTFSLTRFSLFILVKMFHTFNQQLILNIDSFTP